MSGLLFLILRHSKDEALEGQRHGNSDLLCSFPENLQKVAQLLQL